MCGGCRSQCYQGFPMHLALLLVLWLHLLRALFLTLIFVVDRFKLYCTRSSFLPAIQAISYGLQGTGFLFRNYLFWSSGSIASFSYSRILYKKCRKFCFPFLQTSALLILPCLLVLACSFGRSRCFRCCVNFFIIWWLQERKSTVGLALVSVSTYLGSCFNNHQRKIDNDLQKEITKATILYPTMHFVSSRTLTFIQQENFLPVRVLIRLP